MDPSLAATEIVGASYTSDRDGSSLELRLELFTRLEKTQIMTVIADDRIVSQSSTSTSGLRAWSPSRRYLLTFDSRWWTVCDVQTGAVRLCLQEAPHARVMTELGRVSWDREEKRVIMVAERKPKPAAYFDYEGDGLGEGYGQQSSVGIFVLSLDEGVIVERTDLVAGLASNVIPTSPVFAEGGDIFFVALHVGLASGVKYCTNRRTTLMRKKDDGTATTTVALDYTSMWGMHSLFSCPNGVLVWMAATSEFMHQSPQRLWMIGVDSKKPLFLAEDLCDAKLMVSGSCAWIGHVRYQQRCVTRVDLESGQARLVIPERGESVALMDVGVQGSALCLISSQNRMHVVTYGSAATVERIHFRNATSETASLTVVDRPEEGIHYFLLKPIQSKDGPTPLVVHLHGGPHSTLTTEWSRFFDLLLNGLQVTVMAINYTGSLGIPNAERLVGNIGIVDVESVVKNLRFEQSRNTYSSIAVFGGSHGGFLGAHLSCIEELKLACVVLRNPVIDCAAMLSVTDIPDWCVTECGGADSQKMRSQSPVGRLGQQIPCSTLLCLGQADRRVPWFQGRAWFSLLKGLGANVRCEMYPGENHALTAAPETNVRFWQSACHWIALHCTPDRVDKFTIA